MTKGVIYMDKNKKKSILKIVIVNILLCVGIIAIITGINTVNYNNNIETEHFHIKNNIKRIYVEQNITTEIKRGNTYSIIYTNNKDNKNHLLYKKDSLYIKHNSFFENLRRTMRYGGDNEKLTIYIPKNINLKKIYIKTKRGISINNIKTNKLLMKNKYGSITVSHSSINKLNSNDKFGSTIIEKTKIHYLDANNSFGDLKSYESQIFKVKSNVIFGHKKI
jgi:hypothetical protein